ncbi:MBL fold metallo-hydrolase [Arthrobacter ginkgonis]|uniref:MBL fold metallo-hydrolase n=1 Tax=Arthrobacter ginkgonis TaxID=1630594 RepID=A0ABP7DBW0_9MICC
MESILVTGVLQQEAWRRNILPPVEQVAGHIWSIPVPFPDNPMRYTLCYLIQGNGDSVLVDPGWRSPDGFVALEAGLESTGTPMASVTGIVLTHYHPDHVGLAKDVMAANGAWLAIGKNEPRALPGDGGSTLADRYERWGAPRDVIEAYRQGADYRPQFESLQDISFTLEDFDLIPLRGRNLRVVETPGHSPGHICLFDAEANMLLSGDHVLPRISPHVSLEPGHSPDPLNDYVRSLNKVALYAHAEVLPAHEYRFKGLPARVRELRDLHETRSREVREAVETHAPGSVWDTAKHLRWKRGWDGLSGMALGFALGETAAHLAYLVASDASDALVRGRCTELLGTAPANP